jgi:Ser/Thr protein kinase RdoA (MazF antagonist)
VLPPVAWDDLHAAVLVRFVPGTRVEALDPARIATVADVLSALQGQELAGLPPARDWCGGPDWPAIVRSLLPELPESLQPAAESAVQDVLGLESKPCVSHGDLTPYNLRWSDRGGLAVIDWDHVSNGGTAIDVACLLGTVPAAVLTEMVGEAVVRSARVHKRTFPLQVAAAGLLCNDDRLRSTGLHNFVTRETEIRPEAVGG